ncbi:MAG: ADP-ribosylglycohydrolase family protein [Bacteroidota bacterium]
MRLSQKTLYGLFPLLLLCSCAAEREPQPEGDTEEPKMEAELIDQFAGFWLAQCIANWTGLITEMDKIGNVGETKTGDFYTRDNWGGPDRPNIWSGDTISDISPTIDFVLLPPDTVWGADDDTDIEYMYQHLLYHSDTLPLRPKQIREGWLKYIRPEEENYLWVSNQRALDLMVAGVVPPETSDPARNEHYAMIDAQLTTEIFGLYAPGKPERALELAYLPIRTAARHEAAEIAEFYVILHALAAAEATGQPSPAFIRDLASRGRAHLQDGRYPAAMYDYVKAKYDAGISWEAARDSVYQRYQVEGRDGYAISGQKLYCNGCFAAGINFAASLVSLFYGEGNLKETIKIGALCGWDSDNPTATWGGMLGYLYGQKGVEEAFGRELSDRFWIHRTRRNFPGRGMDDFTSMARRGVEIQRRVAALPSAEESAE